ncbi:chaperonin 10-like protein [Mycena metata]|uniref:Chaperonin 10-like protein n=1 Tax=Mycena metata TaxID=1033252 RepID=A0AAD7KDR3_9AGAR|nr:chaperonin 10-like protein [Mycena metata]
MSQKALLIESKGGPFVLKDRAIPTPGAGDLLVKVHAVGLNPVDWKIQAYGIFVDEYPAVLGSDIAGEVEAVGEGVEKFKKGDRVFLQGPYRGRWGGFQQYMVQPAEIVAKIPSNISYSEAATIPVAWVCAAIGLFAPKEIGAGLEPPFDRKAHYKGQTALVVGGSASVGQYAIQLFKLAGFSEIITYAARKHTAHLTSLGATHVVDRAETPLTGSALRSAIQKITSADIKIVLDAVCSEEAQQASYEVLVPGGTLVTLLNPTVKETSTDKRVLHVLGTVVPPENRAFGKVLFENLEGLVADGLIVANRFEDLPGGLGGIVNGLERMKRNEVSGIKLVAHPLET